MEINTILNTKGTYPDAPRNGVIETHTANFGNGYEVDIKVCNTDTDECTPYIDAVLFKDGHEVGLLEPVFDKLDGEYEFDHPEKQGEKLTVIIVVK